MTDSVNLINKLPAELMLRIFGNLTMKEQLKCALVCRLWYIIIAAGDLWREIDLSKEGLCGRTIRITLRFSGRHLKVANFSGSTYFTGRELRTLAKYCPNVQHLRIRGCTKLSVSSLIDFFREPSLHLRQLKQLDMSALHTLRDDVFEQWLDKKLDDNNFNLDKALVVAFPPPLVVVNLSFCRLTWKGIVSLVKVCCRTLTHLILNHLQGLDKVDQTLGVIGEYLNHHLKYLSLQASDITDVGIANFLQYRENAQQLLFSAHPPSKLETLSLSSCPQLTNRTLSLLANAPLNSLRILDIADNQMANDGYELEGLMLNTPTLTQLNISGMLGISTSKILSIGQFMPLLELVFLSYCHLVTDQDILYLFLYCTRLQAIWLDGCLGLHGKFLLPLAALLKARSSGRIFLSMIDCPFITKAAIDEAIDIYPGLHIQTNLHTLRVKSALSIPHIYDQAVLPFSV